MTTTIEQNEFGEDVLVTVLPSGGVVRELMRSIPTITAPQLITVLAFRSRFTDAEKIAIYTAAETSVPIRIWLDDLKAAQNQAVDLADPRIVAGVNAMEYGALIAAGRAAEILA